MVSKKSYRKKISRRSGKKSRRSPLAKIPISQRTKKCRMKKYKSNPICKKYYLRRSCAKNSNSAKCRKFRKSERSVRSKRRMDLSVKKNLRRFCKSRKFKNSRVCKSFRKSRK